MTETESIVYPADWDLAEVQDIAERMRAGGTPSRSKKEYWGGDIPFALIEDITASGLYLDKATERLTQAGLDSSSAWIVPPGAVLLSMYATIGATVVNRIPVATNQAILAIQPKDGCMPEFLALCLRAYKESLSKLNVESTQKNISKGIVSTFKLPIPPIAEQRRIAHVLGTVQQAIEQQERMIRSTTELKQALMQKLFTEGLRGEAQKETEIGLVPESWEVVKLQDVSELIVDCPHTTPVFLSSGVRIARNFNIRDSRFVSEPAHFTSEEQYRDRVRRAAPMPGDVLFSREAPVGEGCVIPEGMRLSLGQRTMFIRTDRAALLPEFLVYSFYAPALSQYMKSIASGLTVAHLNVSDVRTLPLPLPSIDVQRSIADALLAIERKGEQHRAKLTTLQDLFRTLLHELMTGKVRVGETVSLFEEH